jgi:hypothetical protein
MNSADKTRLLFGPYGPPKIKRGGFLACELRGTIRVGGWSNGPIPWPLAAKTGGFIFCGDLLKAIQRESVTAVAHWFGVGKTAVSRWRAKLGVDRSTPGTRKLSSETAAARSTPQWSRKMVALARRPEARAKISNARRGKPMLPRTRKLFLQYAKRRKPDQVKRLMRERTIQRIRNGQGGFIKPEQLWTPEQTGMLGTRPDREIAAALGRSIQAVELKRYRLGIKRFREAKWKPEEIKLLGTLPDAELATKLGRSQASVEYMRIKLSKPYTAFKSRPWTAAELRLLGKYPDANVAEMTQRSEPAVQAKRVQMRLTLRSTRPWKPNEIKLLGRLPDDNIARRTGRTLVAVQLKRRLLGIPGIPPN